MFLMETEVQDWLRQEISMIQNSELNKLTQDISKSRSVGQAQVMNTLSKLNENKQTREGPAFIYTYVPLNANEVGAENTNTEEEDILKDGL